MGRELVNINIHPGVTSWQRQSDCGLQNTTITHKPLVISDKFRMNKIVSFNHSNIMNCIAFVAVK